VRALKCDRTIFDPDKTEIVILAGAFWRCDASVSTESREQSNAADDCKSGTIVEHGCVANPSATRGFGEARRTRSSGLDSDEA
jgi:hypothetical protein